MLHSRFNKEPHSHEVIGCVHVNNFDGFHMCYSICEPYIGCVLKHCDCVSLILYMQIHF